LIHTKTAFQSKPIAANTCT